MSTFWLCVIGLILAYAFFHLRSEKDKTPASPSLQSGLTPQKGWFPSAEVLATELTALGGASCIDLSDGEGHAYTLHTSLDVEYQRWVEKRLQRSMALGGVVAALDPLSGRILALASYNQDPEQTEAFFWKAYPAASLFKIITAAAAIEEGVLDPTSLMAYTGQNHTLYRRDLTQKVHPWSNRITLRKAFALSVNPVFGKIGIHRLGRETLREYGAAFFFGQDLPSEVPFERSHLRVPEDPIGIAEVASGFNRTTAMTPLHAAWIAAILFSDGSAPVPWLVESAQCGHGEALYRHKAEIPIRVLSPETAKNMRNLMEATVQFGTCRKSFRPRKRDRHLRSVVFGGKTGNINNATDTIKYDWFVGYGRDEAGNHPIALSVMMIHGRLLGHRANVVAFDLLKRYFHQCKD